MNSINNPFFLAGIIAAAVMALLFVLAATGALHP